jgi:arsenate reductase (glutaredoxin)
MAIKLYGIASCGTVKKAKKWLEARGIDYEWCDFRKTPPSGTQVAQWTASFGATKMRNTSGGAYRALGDEKKSWDDERWTAAFTADSMLIKRPIIERDGVPVMVGFRGDDDLITNALVD